MAKHIVAWPQNSLRSQEEKRTAHQCHNTNEHHWYRGQWRKSGTRTCVLHDLLYVMGKHQQKPCVLADIRTVVTSVRSRLIRGRKEPSGMVKIPNIHYVGGLIFQYHPTAHLFCVYRTAHIELHKKGTSNLRLKSFPAGSLYNNKFMLTKIEISPYVWDEWHSIAGLKDTRCTLSLY